MNWMFKVIKKIIDGSYEVANLAVKGLGVFAASIWFAAIGIVRSDFKCLPDPPIGTNVTFDATHFNYMAFLKKVSEHLKDISLPIVAKVIPEDYAECKDQITDSALKVGCGVMGGFTLLYLTKKGSDYYYKRQAQLRDRHVNSGYDEEKFFGGLSSEDDSDDRRIRQIF